jgi:hypothetical protein
VVAKLKTLFKPDGCLMASIPNVSFHRKIRKMMRGQLCYAQEGLLDRIHLRFFTLETIEELFASNGLRIERVLKKSRCRLERADFKCADFGLSKKRALTALHRARASLNRRRI